jgi:hypothetical protein
MAEEVVVRQMLTNEMIERGAELTRQLDCAPIEVIASFWLYISESEKWRLIIASPQVTKNGPKKVYRKIQDVLAKIPEESPRISLMDISVVQDDYPLISLLRRAIKPEGTSGVRFSRNVINGQLIEDAYIYRMT